MTRKKEDYEKDLIPLNRRSKEEARKIQVKGGQSRSLKKQLSSRINGLLNNKSLSSEQRYMLSLLQDKRFIDVVIELISMNLEDTSNPRRRDKVIAQLTSFIPARQEIVNVDLTPIDVERRNKELDEQIKDLMEDE